MKENINALDEINKGANIFVEVKYERKYKCIR